MAGETLTQRGPPDPSRGAVEPSDLNPKGAGWTIAALAGVVALVALFAAGLLLWFGSLSEEAPPRPVATHAPPLQTDERADRAAIEAGPRASLAQTRDGLSIDQAMARTAALGWDAPR